MAPESVGKAAARRLQAHGAHLKQPAPLRDGWEPVASKAEPQIWVAWC